MALERVEIGQATVIRVYGDLDDGVVQELRQELYACLCEGRANVILNCHAVGRVSYMSLGIIVERLRRFRSIQGDIKLVGVNTCMQRLFRMAGIKALFDVFETETQALEGFKQAA